MKIIHTGDIHIGAAFSSLSAEKARLRQAEITDGFRRLCTYARENRIEAVCIAGDLFDGNAVGERCKAEVFSAMESAASTHFFYVSGNHDDEFYAGEVLPQNLHLFSREHGWYGYDLSENVTVTGMDTRNFSANRFAEIPLQPSRFNIVLLHGDVSQNTGKESIPLSLLAGAPIDYLALGHIHQPTLQSVRFGARGRYRYCGCLEGRGFDETGAHGFFLLDVQNGVLQSEKFFSVATREVLETRVDISVCKTYADLENAVFAAVRNIDGKHSVKVTLCGTYVPELPKNIPLLSRKIGERFFQTRIEDESRLAIRAETYAGDCSIYGEFVKEVGRYAFTEEQRQEILEIGLQALRGEEIPL